MAVRLGIVDTGVDSGHPSFKRRKPRGIGIRLDRDRYEYQPDYLDLHGHGTAVAARIQTFCRHVQIYAVRIAQQNGDSVACRVPEEVLAMGIDRCTEQGIRIVNVSYSIAAAAVDGSLSRACQKAHERNVIVVASYRNGERGPVYPAAFSTVIGVRRLTNSRPGEISIVSQRNHDVSAWGESSSMAAAQVSAMVGRMLAIDDSLSLEQVFAFLSEVAVPTDPRLASSSKMAGSAARIRAGSKR